ncbi:MAG: DUF1588 domain-containing protein [Polyangiaceae bacterium]|jgi:hypothetical protein|nr:DUF1588 domain-containing protein [Polyangiaceae bacterium]
MRSTTPLVLLLSSVVSGCSGARPIATEVLPSAPAPSSPAPLLAAAAPLRRLTSEEYNNAVRDLLGDTTRPADAFPADEVVGGFETNTTTPVSSLHVERYMNAAEALAAAAVRRIDQLAPCPEGAAPDACARRFLGSFGRLAFRRPLDAGEIDAYLALYREKHASAGHTRAIQLLIEALLQSPHFLYRVEPPRGAGAQPLDGLALATRLSFFLWASIPDAPLLDEAEAGNLASARGLELAARRMLLDPRSLAGIRNFHRQWLDLRRLATESRDSGKHPRFTPRLKEAMAEETLRFTAHAALGGGDLVGKLLTSRSTFVNGALSELYGVAPAGEGFAQRELPEGQRAGLLTQASFLTIHANAEETSPILRGKFVRERLLCQVVPPPPPGVSALSGPPDRSLPRKEQLGQHQRNPSCASCHRKMDPIGFGLEHYDAVGAWRTEDGRFPVDAVGQLAGTEDVDGPFDGAIELGSRLASSQQVRRCVATHWFRSAVGRVEQEEDAASLAAIHQAFAASGFGLRELVVSIVTSDAFRHSNPGGERP